MIALIDNLLTVFLILIFARIILSWFPPSGGSSWTETTHSSSSNIRPSSVCSAVSTTESTTSRWFTTSGELAVR